jgi:hypothetical protein
MKFLAITLSLMAAASAVTLDQLIQPVALSITDSVAGNMTLFDSLIPSGSKTQLSTRHRTLMRVHKKFKPVVPKVLKSHAHKVLVHATKTGNKKSEKQVLSWVKKEALLTLRELQVRLFREAHKESKAHDLAKRDMRNLDLVKR